MSLLVSALLLAAVSTATPVPSSAAPASATSGGFVIVNPGGRGDQGLAAGFLADFAAAVQASWPPGAARAPALAGNYHVNTADALGSIRGRKPLFGIVSPAFYLEQRATLPMVPLLVPVRVEKAPNVVHLVVREGDAKTLARVQAGDLAGLKLGGQLAAEPRWLLRVALAKLHPKGQPVLVPLAKTLEAARQLAARQVDVVALVASDWAKLGEAGKAGGLSLAFSSDPLPEGPVVAFCKPSDSGRLAAATRCADALLRFPETEAGRGVLQRMGLTGYRRLEDADHATFLALQSLVDAKP